MDIYTQRLNNLKAAMKDFRSKVAFARHYQLDATYLSQLLHGHRRIGERTARTLEEKLGWPRLAMDMDMGAGEQAAALSINTARDKTKGRQVPLISYVQAGLWREAVDPYAPGAGEDELLTQLYLGPHAFALTIHGNSMFPEFREGDIILVDPDVVPTPGDYVVARNADNEATFKKYRSRGVNACGEPIIELVPLNPDFPTLHSETTPIQIIGTMMEHRRYRNAARC